jgi:hypothetical protein
MMRTLNIALVVITGVACLGLYRVAEQARITANDLHETRAAIAHERDAMSVLGAEWARQTQPSRIQALVQRHLDLTDKPQIELSSLDLLPQKNAPLAPEGAIRDAKAVVPLPAPAPQNRPRLPVQSTPLPVATFVALHTGT